MEYRKDNIYKITKYIVYGILILAFGFMPFCVFNGLRKMKTTYTQKAVDGMPAGYYMVVDDTHYYYGYKNITYKYVKLVKTRNSTLIYVSNDLKHWTQTFDIDVTKLQYMSSKLEKKDEH